MRQQTPEHRAKIAAAISETRMAWCPKHLRDEHHNLVRKKRIPAAEAREIILSQWQSEIARSSGAA